MNWKYILIGYGKPHQSGVKHLRNAFLITPTINQEGSDPIRKFLISLFLIISASQATAAEITVEACASATVTFQSAPNVMSGFPEECINLAESVELEESQTRTAHSDSRTHTFAYGGCNSSGADVNYTMEHRWRYTITTNADEDERANGWVKYGVSPTVYTEGSDSFVSVDNGTIENNLCVDAFVKLSASAEAVTGLDSFVLFNDQGVNGLFFDINNPGHGFDFNVHTAGLTIFYYGHTAAGERLWLISETHTENLEYGVPMELEMFEVNSGSFGNPIMPETSWGMITIWLSDCNSGHASFNGADGILEMDFVRLAGLKNLDCS